MAPAFAAMASQTGTGIDWNIAPADAQSALPNAAYLGAYFDDYYGKTEIARTDDGLVLRIGPQPLEFPLTHYDRDTFIWEPTLDTGVPRGGLTFTIGPAGTAVAFRDECLATDGPGIMTRREDGER